VRCPATAFQRTGPTSKDCRRRFISCAEIDPCRDEAVEYAIRLFQAYVHTELHPPDDRVTFGDHIFGPDAKTDRCLVADEDRRAGESRQVDRPAGADDLDGVAGRDVLGPSGPRPCTLQIDEEVSPVVFSQRTGV
jgi:hypothetical protein